MTVPLISVVIPTKNRAHLLRETLQSVCYQTFQNWEAIVVDDGSTDETPTDMALLATHEPRVRFIQREGDTDGACACRNQGVAAARGKYLIFLDSDDLLAPDCLECRLAIMERNSDLDFCVFQAEVFGDGAGSVRRTFSYFNHTGDLDRFLYHDLVWEITSPIWRRDAFLKIGGFDERLPSWQDVELHIRAIAHGLHYLKFDISDHFIRWQNDPEKISLQQRHRTDHLDAGLSMLARIHHLLEQANLLNWTRQRALVGWHFMIAERHIRRHRYRRAHEAWRRPLGKGWMGYALYLQGLMVLSLGLARRSPNGLAGRIVNRWVRHVRFQEQPALLRFAPDFRPAQPPLEGTPEITDVTDGRTASEFKLDSSGTARTATPIAPDRVASTCRR